MSQPTASSNYGQSDTIEYEPYSGWAFVAFVLGVLSAVALAGPILWLVPVFAVVVALIALRKIKASDRRFSGRYIALLGLLLAIFFGIAGPARLVSRRYFLEARAARFAGKFMELLQQNQPLAAFQLTMPAGLRKPLAADQKDLDTKDATTRKAYIEFLKSAPLKSFLEDGQQAKIELASATFAASNDVRDDVFVCYRIHFPSDGAAKATTVFMDVARSLAYGSHTEQWQIIPPALREPTQ
jgi:hypothetical protein